LRPVFVSNSRQNLRLPSTARHWYQPDHEIRRRVLGRNECDGCRIHRRPARFSNTASRGGRSLAGRPRHPAFGLANKSILRLMLEGDGNPGGLRLASCQRQTAARIRVRQALVHPGGPRAQGSGAERDERCIDAQADH
jgi:hypothetical protein